MNALHLLSTLLTHCQAVPSMVHALPQGQGLPANLREVYARHLAALNAKVDTGTIFDGPVAVLRGWSLANDQLHLQIQQSTYVPMTAVRLTYVEALQTGQLPESAIPDIPNVFGACLCACVSVLTADNQILSLRRSAKLSNAGTMSLGLGEVLEGSDFDAGPLSLHHAGARAIREELGVSLTPAQIARFVKPMYLARGQECGTWVFLIAVDLRDAGAEFCSERILAQAHLAVDGWEADARQPVTFDRPSLDAFLATYEGRLGLWAPELVELLSKDFLARA